MKTPLRTVAAFIALCSILGSTEALAGPFVIPGNSPQTDENVLLDSGASDAVIHGTLNQSGGIVNFSSTSGDLVSPSSGQARIEAASGNDPFNQLAFWLANDATFTSAIFNIFNDAGRINITVGYDGGQTFITSFDTGDGSNFFTVLTSAGSVLNSVTLTSLDGSFNDLRQFRIGGYASSTPVINVPDHGFTLAMVGIAFVTLAAYRRLAVR